MVENSNSSLVKIFVSAIIIVGIIQMQFAYRTNAISIASLVADA